MKVEFVIRGLVKLGAGGCVKFGERLYTITDVSMLYHKDPFTKWEIELDLVPHSLRWIVLDFDTDSRVMSWRTFGAPQFDTESSRAHLPIHHWPSLPD
jgi:hypothetical protein